MDDASRLPAGAALKAQRLGEWEQLLRRYPLASPWGLALQVGATLLGNGLVVWLVASGRMTPFELVLLVAIECVLLIGIAWVQKRRAPPGAVDPNPMTRSDRLKTLAFLLFWLGGVYSFVLLGLVPSGTEMRGLLRDPIGFLAASSLKWPLFITLLTAAIDALQDHAHFARHGGKFLSTPGFHGAARMLTLVLGGIPFVVPFFGTVIALKLGIERLHARLTRDSREGSRKALVTTLLGVGVVASLLGGLVLLDRVGASLQWRDGDWWALCYGAAKFVSELFIVCLPLIATKAHAEDSAVGSPSPRRARRR
jgi:hypothetical protein